MPWSVKANYSSCPSDHPWAVVAKDTGALVACHATQAEAVSHMQALYANYSKGKKK